MPRNRGNLPNPSKSQRAQQNPLHGFGVDQVSTWAASPTSVSLRHPSRPDVHQHG